MPSTASTAPVFGPDLGDRAARDRAKSAAARRPPAAFASVRHLDFVLAHVTLRGSAADHEDAALA
jgi:hypothetical protein